MEIKLEKNSGPYGIWTKGHFSFNPKIPTKAFFIKLHVESRYCHNYNIFSSTISAIQPLFYQLVMFKYLLQCNINDSPPSPSFPSSSSCRSSGSSNLEDSSASTGSSSLPCCPVPSCSSSPSSLKFPSSPCKASLIFSSLCSSSASGCPSVCSFLSFVEPVF